MQKAKAALNAHDPTLAAIGRTYHAACNAIPHVTTKASYLNHFGERRTMTTQGHHVEAARRMLTGLKSHGADMDDYVATCREVIAAGEVRHAEIERIDESLGYSDAYDRNLTLAEAAHDAEKALFEMPAPDAEALLWKLDSLFGPEAIGEADYSPSYSMEWINRVIADVHHLLGQGRA